MSGYEALLMTILAEKLRIFVFAFPGLIIVFNLKRRRTAMDELNMRSIFQENDVICVSPVTLSCLNF